MISAGQIGTSYGETIPSTSPPIAGGMPETFSAPPSGGDSSGILNNGNAMMWASSAQAVGSIVNGIGSYLTQMKLMGIRERVAVAQYDHQDRMSGHNKDMQIETLRVQETKGAIQVEGNRKYLTALRERRKAEGELKVAETTKHEAELTEKAGDVNKKALQQVFDQYAYGNPVHA